MKKNFHALGKRALALLIVLTMCVSLLQVTAFAAPGDEPTAESVAQQQAEDQAKAEAEKKAAEEKAEAEKKAAEEQAKAEAEKKAEEEQAKADAEKKDEAEDQDEVETEEITEDKDAVKPEVKPETKPETKPENTTNKTESVVVMQPVAPVTLPSNSNAFSYVVGMLNAAASKDELKCPKCGGTNVVAEKGSYVCRNCDDYVTPVNPGEKPSEPEKHEHSYGENGRCACGELDPKHVHEFDDSGKCVCGDQHEHDWKYTPEYYEYFTHTKYCSSCGEKVKEACTKGKVYDPWAGQYVYKCTLCNYWSEPVDGTHQWTEVWEPNNEGYHIMKCKDPDCEEVREEECKPEVMPDGKVVCPTCGWVKFDDGKPGDIIGDCEHEYGNVYQHGEGSHWQVCNKCHGKSESEKCNFILMFEENTNIAEAYVCPVCGNTKTTEKVPVCDPNDPTKGHNWQVNRTELALDGKTQLVIVKCANCGAEKVDGKCDAATSGFYKLTVQCVDEQGTVLKTVDGGCYAKNAYYKVECPEISDYTADQDVVYGNMPAKDTVIPVVYWAGYTLTIDYVYEGANAPFDSVSKTLKNGDEYSVTSPDKTKEGYELAASNEAVISGKINGKSEHYKVEYKLSTYTWTIKYVDMDGQSIGVPDVKHEYTVKNVDELPALNTDVSKGYKFVKVDGDTKPTSDNLGNAVTTVYYEPATDAITLTVHYHYGPNSSKEGQQVAQDYTNNSLIAGQVITVPSVKAPLGYAAETDAVTVTMGEGNTEATIKYDPIPYTWTINYVDENGQPMKDIATFTKTFNVENMSDLLDEPSPTVEGYTVDQAVVSAPTALKDITVTVHYSRNAAKTFALTIVHNYMNRNGTLNHSVTQAGGTFENGAAYTTSALNETGYTLTTTPVNASGTINGQAVTVVYEYTANAPTGGGGGGTPPVNPNPPEEPNPPAGPDDPIEVPDDPNVPLEPGPGTDDPQEPGPGDDVIIDDPNVPLAPGPDIPDVDIDDPDVPMTNKPTAPAEKNPVPQPTATGLTEIEDEDVPLAEVPQTGDNTGLWIAAAILAACGLVTLGKKREDA